MKTTTKTITLATATILLSLAAFALTGYNQLTDAIQLKENQDCRLETWQETVPTYGTCTSFSTHRVCDDEPLNTSCRDVVEETSYTCRNGTEIIQHSREACKDTSMEVAIDTASGLETYMLNNGEWGSCSKEVVADGVIITCESWMDSDRNGKCKPGESCIRFIVTENGIARQMRNSRETWSEEDDSFVLPKLDMEVEG